MLYSAFVSTAPVAGGGCECGWNISIRICYPPISSNARFRIDFIIIVVVDSDVNFHHSDVNEKFANNPHITRSEIHPMAKGRGVQENPTLVSTHCTLSS